MQKVPLAMFAYRTTVSNVTGVTPFKGVFGVDSCVLLDVIWTKRGVHTGRGGGSRRAADP